MALDPTLDAIARATPGEGDRLAELERLSRIQNGGGRSRLRYFGSDLSDVGPFSGTSDGRPGPYVPFRVPDGGAIVNAEATVELNPSDVTTSSIAGILVEVYTMSEAGVVGAIATRSGVHLVGGAAATARTGVLQFPYPAGFQGVWASWTTPYAALGFLEPGLYRAEMRYQANAGNIRAAARRLMIEV